MTVQASLATQLLQLLTSLSEQGDLHLSEIDADLQQTTDLLHQAIDKLGKDFMGIHDAVAAQQAALAAVPDGAPISPALRTEIARLQQVTDTHINAAVTALQFQDMTSQLIGRALGHVVGLRAVLDVLARQPAPLTSASPDSAALAVLGSVNVALNDASVKQRNVTRKAVAQTHMESGDIDLF